jgi:hypothetical protein
MVRSRSRTRRDNHGSDRGGKGAGYSNSGGNGPSGRGDDNTGWAWQAYHREKNNKEELQKKLEEVVKKQRQDEEEKSLMTKIHTGVTACLRMAGVAAPLPAAASGSGHQSQHAAPLGAHVAPSLQGQAPQGSAGFSLNPLQYLNGAAGGSGQQPLAPQQGQVTGGAFPRAADVAWGVPDGGAVLAGLFAGLKKVDELAGRLNSGQVEVVRRPRSASRKSRRSSRSSRSGRSGKSSSRKGSPRRGRLKSRSTSSSKAKKSKEKREKRSPVKKEKTKQKRRRSPSSKPSSPSRSSSPASSRTHRDAARLPVKDFRLVKPDKPKSKSKKDAKGTVDVDPLTDINDASVVIFRKAVETIKEALDISDDTDPPEPPTNDAQGFGPWKEWLDKHVTDSVLVDILKKNGVKARGNKMIKIDNLLLLTINQSA